MGERGVHGRQQRRAAAGRAVGQVPGEPVEHRPARHQLGRGRAPAHPARSRRPGDPGRGCGPGSGDLLGAAHRPGRRRRPRAPDRLQPRQRLLRRRARHRRRAHRPPASDRFRGGAAPSRQAGRLRLLRGWRSSRTGAAGAVRPVVDAASGGRRDRGRLVLHGWFPPLRLCGTRRGLRLRVLRAYGHHRHPLRPGRERAGMGVARRLRDRAHRLLAAHGQQPA